jgi:hypothetical protein
MGAATIRPSICNKRIVAFKEYGARLAGGAPASRDELTPDGKRGLAKHHDPQRGHLDRDSSETKLSRASIEVFTNLRALSQEFVQRAGVCSFAPVFVAHCLNQSRVEAKDYPRAPGPWRRLA